MLHLVNNVRLLLLAGWIGAAIFFSAVVAPSAFAILRRFELANAGEIAGSIVSRTLSVINISGFVVCLLALVLGVLIRRSYTRSDNLAQVVFLAIAALSTGAGEWLIAARMRTLRAGFGVPIDQVAIGDPARVAFQSLHGYSVAALSVAIIAALISFFLMTRRARSSGN